MSSFSDEEEQATAKATAGLSTARHKQQRRDAPVEMKE
jgi:hypothetical protein